MTEFAESPSSAPSTRSRSKLIAIIGSVVLVAALVAGWFLVLSPKATTVTVSPLPETVMLGAPVVIQGAVQPADERQVDLQVKGAQGWTTSDTTTSDQAGLFTFELAPAEVGAVEVRVIVRDRGRWSEVVGAPVTTKLLGATKVKLNVPATLRADRAGQLAGIVSPIGARTLHFQVSSNEETWTDVATTTSKADGRFTFKFKSLEPGTSFFRVIADASDDRAAFAGKSVSVRVEDYAAAGEFYLLWIAKSNAVSDEENALTDDMFLTFPAYKAFCVRAAPIAREVAGKLKGYNWPRAVAKSATDVAQSLYYNSDWYSQCANSSDFGDIPTFNDPYDSKSTAGSTALRAELGLPPKS